MNPRLLVPLVLIALVGCKKDSPEAQIQKAFDVCVKAIEDADAGTVVDKLSPGFSGPEGMGRDDAKLYLMGLLRQGKIGITVFSSRITVKGSQADQSVEMMLTSRSGSGLLPQDASHRFFQLRWERLNGDWRVRSLKELRNS